MQLDLDLQRTPEPRVHTVSALTRRLRELIERGLGEVWVQGEVSNHRRQASGHQYFTLKDDTGQLACVFFASAAALQRNLRLADGQCIQVFGLLTVYEPRGQCQLVVRLARECGEGALRARFEALKKMLAAEGLFDTARKRPLPRFPRRVALVTSPAGAAIQDFLKVLHRRDPGIQVVVNPVRVQGRGAALEIARAIRLCGELERFGLPPADVIVVTRGGGSAEDLWEFNEEAVARAIAASPVPVLSAIGHEIDFTIADFAADVRAPTPSAAAEILAAERIEVVQRLERDLARLQRVCLGRLQLLGAHLDAARQSAIFREPRRRLEDLLQQLDRHGERMERTTKLVLERLEGRLARFGSQLAAQSPSAAVQAAGLRSRLLLQSFERNAALAISERQARLDRAQGILAALNPQATLTRGFTITMDEDGRPLASPAQVSPGARLRTRFADGEVESVARTPA